MYNNNQSSRVNGIHGRARETRTGSGRWTAPYRRGDVTAAWRLLFMTSSRSRNRPIKRSCRRDPNLVADHRTLNNIHSIGPMRCYRSSVIFLLAPIPIKKTTDHTTYE
ncbi:hypothetical protein EVAR_26075_1 [Eumeta japonica]|uniref:Uncharacterized protein n=1 Tax=Eumeta variegata TaxID=151549 RepID=A0A4C2AAX6_EUMVA|nr:hypothetical protein EVAR_26075_1 [Eumeta japonica]